MAKRTGRKRRSGRRRKPISRKFRKGMQKAAMMLDDHQYSEAYALLVDLIKQNPGSKIAMQMILEAAIYLNNWGAIVTYGEKLYPKESGEDQAVTLNNMVMAYMSLMMPALAYQTAQILQKKHPHFSQMGEVANLIQNVEELFAQVENEESHFKELNLPESDKIPFSAELDRMRLYTESNMAEEAIHSAKILLNTAPDFAPVLNNLSLAHFLNGNLKEAIETARGVVERYPDNFHSLSNLTRFCFLSGNFDDAQQYVKRLAAIESDKEDLPLKKAEAFAYLGDHDGILAAYESAKKFGGEINPLLLHLAASAKYRFGEIKEAWKLWEEAVNISPEYSLAAVALKQRDLPPNERDLPWYWSVIYWISPKMLETLTKRFEDAHRLTDRKVEKIVEELIAQHPQLISLAPHILDRGDNRAREFVFNLANTFDDRELAEVVLEFGLGQIGADEARMGALQVIQQNYPDLLPADKRVTIWQKGKPVEINLLGFEIYDEPNLSGWSPKNIRMHDRAYNFLKEQKWDQAEELLNQLIKDAPQFPSPYNQLALLYEKTGRKDEAYSLTVKTHERFPDYVFSRVALARKATLENDFEQAKDLLEPIMQLPRLHISEFQGLVKAQISLALGLDDKDTARMWLEMWKRIDRDNEELLAWQFKIGGDGMMGELFDMIQSMDDFEEFEDDF